MSNLKHVLRNRTTTSKPLQATKHRASCTPISCVVPVVQAGDKPIAEDSRSPARCTHTAGDPGVDLIDEVHSRAADHCTRPPVTWHSATLRHPTPEEGAAPLFKNSDEERDYLGRKNTRLEKLREI
jgi:hypothetical protein